MKHGKTLPPSRQACGPKFHMNFRYRGSIMILDTWDGIVLMAPISSSAQHYRQWSPSQVSRTSCLPHNISFKANLTNHICRPSKTAQYPISITVTFPLMSGLAELNKSPYITSNNFYFYYNFFFQIMYYVLGVEKCHS